MEGPPGYSLADFETPRLRKSTLDPETIDWANAKVLGRGLDGWVWLVKFGNQGPYVLKLVGLPTLTELSRSVRMLFRSPQSLAWPSATAG